MVGDGSYLMMNSDIYSSVLTGHKLIVVVCDNGGFAVINRLQNFKGVPSFNNLLRGLPDREPGPGRFRQACRGHGRHRRACPFHRRSGGRAAAGQGGRSHHVIVIDTDPANWTPGDAWWDVGVPAESNSRRACARPRPITRRASASSASASEIGPAMEIRLGIAPIAWTNNDLPQLGGETSLETCLTESRQAGFSGTETGVKFPMDPKILGPILARHELALVSGWFSGELLRGALDEEKARLADQMATFRSLGAPVLVYAETTGSVQSRIDTGVSRRPRLPDADFPAYGRKLTALAEWMAGEGVAMAYHHHMGTVVETQREIDLLMAHSGPAVGLLLDTGHLAYAGGGYPRDDAASWQAHQSRPLQGYPARGAAPRPPGRPVLPRRHIGGRLHRPRRRHDRLLRPLPGCWPKPAIRAGSSSRPSRTLPRPRRAPIPPWAAGIWRKPSAPPDSRFGSECHDRAEPGEALPRRQGAPSSPAGPRGWARPSLICWRSAAPKAS